MFDRTPSACSSALGVRSAFGRFRCDRLREHEIPNERKLIVHSDAASDARQHRPKNAEAECVWIHPEPNLPVKTKGPQEKRALLPDKRWPGERRDYLTTISPVMPECIVQ